nr:phospholysine phosphohistidine inorganic pyrophosphate phosphatase isoform X1 [Macaca fascicularis]
MAPWGERLAGVRGVLLDISGVLYDSGAGGGTAIAGSVEAVARLKGSRLKVRFCTNESQKSRAELVGQLRRLGFDISEGEVTAPAPAACQILKERGLRPYLLIHDGVRSEFDQIDTSNPNCVVIADAGESFSYQNMNNAFQVLMELENPVLISLGKGRYYKETSGLMLDVGPYMKALEYACGIKAEVVGKPSPEFFKSALQAIGVEAHQAVMIGDDIVGDVGGAQRCGMRALQVRTGKFRLGTVAECEVSEECSAHLGLQSGSWSLPATSQTLPGLGAPMEPPTCMTYGPSFFLEVGFCGSPWLGLA